MATATDAQRTVSRSRLQHTALSLGDERGPFGHLSVSRGKRFLWERTGHSVEAPGGNQRGTVAAYAIQGPLGFA